MAWRRRPEGQGPDVGEGSRDFGRPADLRSRVLPFLRDIGLAVVVVVVILAFVFAYTQRWPPMVVVESSSMQHSDTESFVGVIDTGDLVLVQNAPGRGDVITWVEGRRINHGTYGDFGDVVVFRRPGSPPTATPIIHRVIVYLERNGSRYDVPSLDPRVPDAFPRSWWDATNAGGTPVSVPYGLNGSLTLRHMGYRGDLTVSIDLRSLLVSFPGESGYITMGDNNAPQYDRWLVPQASVFGRARGELPWFGLLKLTIFPEPSCCRGWGDPEAPRNSWDSLLVSLVAIVAGPFAIPPAVDFVRARLNRWKEGREGRKGPEGPGSSEEPSEGADAGPDASLRGPEPEAAEPGPSDADAGSDEGRLDL